MATRTQLQWWSSSCHFDVASKVPKPILLSQRVWMAGLQLFHQRQGCGILPLLPLQGYQAFTIHHLPDKNFQRVGNLLAGRKPSGSGGIARVIKPAKRSSVRSRQAVVTALELHLFVQAALSHREASGREAPNVSWTPVYTGWNPVYTGWNHARMLPDAGWRCGPHSAPCDAFCDVLLNTRKYDPRCQTALPQLIYPLLVTGTGGTGSTWLAHMLETRGLSVGHESYGRDVTVSWKHAVSDAYLGELYPRVHGGEWRTKLLPPPEAGRVPDSAKSPRFRCVAHLVRCPLDTIASLITHAPSSNQFQRAAGVAPASVLPLREKWSLDDKIAFNTLLWIEWNTHIERYADFRMSTEELASDVGLKHLDQILLAAGLRVHAMNGSAEDVSTKSGRLETNQRKHVHNLTFASLKKALVSSRHVPTGVTADQVISRLMNMTQAYGFGSECTAPRDSTPHRSTHRTAPHHTTQQSTQHHTAPHR